MKILLVKYDNQPFVAIMISERETAWYGLFLDKYATEYDYDRSRLTGVILDLIDFTTETL